MCCVDVALTIRRDGANECYRCYFHMRVGSFLTCKNNESRKKERERERERERTGK